MKKKQKRFVYLVARTEFIGWVRPGRIWDDAGDASTGTTPRRLKKKTLTADIGR